MTLRFSNKHAYLKWISYFISIPTAWASHNNSAAIPPLASSLSSHLTSPLSGTAAHLYSHMLFLASPPQVAIHPNSSLPALIALTPSHGPRKSSWTCYSWPRKLPIFTISNYGKPCTLSTTGHLLVMSNHLFWVTLSTCSSSTYLTSPRQGH